MGQGEAFEDVDDVFAGGRNVDGVVQDQPGVFVDDGGDVERDTVLKVVGLEIDRPHMSGIQRRGGCVAGGVPRRLCRHLWGTRRSLSPLPLGSL